MKVEIRATITLDEDEQFERQGPDGRWFLVTELRTSVSDEADKLFGRGVWLNKDGSIAKKQPAGGAFGTVPIADLPEKVRQGLRERSVIRPRQPKVAPRHLQSVEARRQAMLG